MRQRLRLLVLMLVAAAVAVAAFLPDGEALHPGLAVALLALLALAAAPHARHARTLLGDLHVTESHVAVVSPFGGPRVAWEHVAEVVVTPADPARFGTGDWRIDFPLRRLARALAQRSHIPRAREHDALAAALWSAAQGASGADPEISLHASGGHALLRLRASHGWDAAHALGARAAELGRFVQVVA